MGGKEGLLESFDECALSRRREGSAGKGDFGLVSGVAVVDCEGDIAEIIGKNVERVLQKISIVSLQNRSWEVPCVQL